MLLPTPCSLSIADRMSDVNRERLLWQARICLVVEAINSSGSDAYSKEGYFW